LAGNKEEEMMSEQTVFNLDYLWAQLLQVSILLQRPAIQMQLWGIVISILLAWLISKGIWIQLKRQFPKLSQFELSELRLSVHQYSSALIRNLLTPTLCLIAVSWLRIGFEQRVWFAGYLSDGIKVLWYFWFYRLFLTSLYAIFPSNSVTRYRRRFLAPLFVLFVTGRILSWFIDLQEVSQVNFIELFGESVTLEAVFVTVAGLYFWIIGTSLLEKLILNIFLGKTLRDARIQQVVSLLLRYFLIGLGFVLIFGYAGVSGTAVAAITGGLSVGIGFGLKEVISNFVSGIWLLFEGALKPGDIITIEGKMSKVTKLGMRATTVQVIGDNSEEIIPNQAFFTQNVSTLTGSNQLVRRSLIVGASYKCSPPKVVKILLQVAKEHPKVLKYPEPQAFALGFGDSSIDFELKFWIDDPLMFKPVTSQLVCNIWQAFADNDIEIPYPQRDLHIRSHDKSSNDNF
jgi:small-conductance mechanosensitive channel